MKHIIKLIFSVAAVLVLCQACPSKAMEKKPAPQQKIQAQEVEPYNEFLRSALTEIITPYQNHDDDLDIKYAIHFSPLNTASYITCSTIISLHNKATDDVMGFIEFDFHINPKTNIVELADFSYLFVKKEYRNKKFSRLLRSIAVELCHELDVRHAIWIAFPRDNSTDLERLTKGYVADGGSVVSKCPYSRMMEARSTKTEPQKPLPINGIRAKL